MFGHVSRILAVLVEHLDAAVAAISDVEAPFVVDRDGVHGRPELTRARSFLPPRHQELAVLVELDDALVLIAVGDEERAVGQPGDVGRPAEMAAVVAPDQPLAKRHDELLAVVGEFEDLLQIVVDDPDVLLRDRTD